MQVNNHVSKEYMKFNVSLKDQQKEFLDQVVSDFSLGEIEINQVPRFFLRRF